MSSPAHSHHSLATGATHERHCNGRNIEAAPQRPVDNAGLHPSGLLAPITNYSPAASSRLQLLPDALKLVPAANNMPAAVPDQLASDEVVLLHSPKLRPDAMEFVPPATAAAIPDQHAPDDGLVPSFSDQHQHSPHITCLMIRNIPNECKYVISYSYAIIQIHAYHLSLHVRIKLTCLLVMP